MKKLSLSLIFLAALMLKTHAQVVTLSDSSFIIILNQEIDNYVVKHNVAELEKLYANDFVFSHGSGRIEGKEGWFKSVAKGSFLMRQHDSVTVEMHPGIAIVRGKLTVHKKADKETSIYHLKYVRVYAHRDKQWQMISHITVWEQHEANK